MAGIAGTEGHLLHAGAHLDVAGRRKADLPDAVLAGVVSRHPRDGFGKAFADLMRQDARHRPHSRAGVLWRLGVRLPIALNSFPQPRTGP